MRVVLDTNAVVAGLLWRGAPYALLGYALTRTIQCFATEPLIAELERVLGYPHLAQRLVALNTTGAELLAEYRAMV